MKKFLSVILVAMMVVSSVCFPANALTTNEIISTGMVNYDSSKTHYDHFYEDDFVEQYKDMISPYGDYSYDEVYYYYDTSSIRWALVVAMLQPAPPMNYYAVFGEKFSLTAGFAPFKMLYGVYDSEQEKFFDICELEDLSVYETLEERIDAIEFLYKFGDADLDGDISILDATYIQLVLAKRITFPKDDVESYMSCHGEMRYTSDIDRDGERTIMDATGVQKCLANIVDEPGIEPTEPPVKTPDESEDDGDVKDTYESSTEAPTENPTEDPSLIYGPKPLLDIPWCSAHFSISSLGKEKKVYCCLYDDDKNVIGDSDLFSVEHQAVIVAGKKQLRYAHYYPKMRNLEIDPGYYMYDFYNENGKMLFRSFVTIKE